MSIPVWDVSWQWLVKRCHAIWDNIYQNGLWRRMFKIVLATALTDAIMLIPKVEAVLGKAVYLGGITTAFGHPGRRLGQMVEALVLVILGTLLGSAWSILGLYLSSLLMDSDQSAAYTVRGVFLAIALLLHGFFRSHTPRVFLGTVLFIICSVVNLVSTAKTVSPMTATQLIYPIFIAIGILLIINLTVFPEFSSSYLGGTVTDGFHEVASSLRHAGDYFTRIEKYTNSDTDPMKTSSQSIKISSVTASKTTIRSKVNACKTALRECNFELSYSTLPPSDLKATNQVMAKITGNVAAIIGACESKYALLGDDTELANIGSVKSSVEETDTGQTGVLTDNNTTPPTLNIEDELELIKPQREIESGDPGLLRNLVKQITPAYQNLQNRIDRAVDVINAGISYTYRVPRLPSGIKTPAGIEVEQIDDYAEIMRRAVETFDNDIRSALKAANVWGHVEDGLTDLMPREEVFLISSFYLNLRQAAMHVITMLEQVRTLIDQYHMRKGKRRFYAPQIAWRSWLYTGGGEDQDAPEVRNRTSGQSKHRDNSADNEDDSEDDDEVNQNLLDRNDTQDANTSKAKKSSARTTRAMQSSERKTSEDKRMTPVTARLRVALADTLDAVQYSPELQYAFKVTIAAILVLWPALVSSWNKWFSVERGLWAALQLILITEPTTGNSIQSFILRAFGTTLGCLWGWAAYQIGGGNRIVCGFLIAIGVIPSAYVVVGSSYVKAGIVSSVSITVVALATEVGTVPGSATENFLKRFLAFTIGAAVALVVQFSFLPVKARTRMVECLETCLRHVQTMEHAMAFGLETAANLDLSMPIVTRRFDKASAKAKAALLAAEGYIPFVRKEPRLKGSFSGQLLVYEEIIFVLHQIVDRLDNMAVLRTNYGSGPLQEYNAQILQYRRNLAASIITCLFAVHEALATHLPLPQFVPSARLAHIRLINRVREVVRENIRQPPEIEEDHSATFGHVMTRSFLSWNATAMSLAEVIEYLEELVELTKLLVGANEFRTGLLFRPSFEEHTEMIQNQDIANVDGSVAEGLQKQNTFGPDSKGSEDVEVPYSLKRIQTRKFDAVLKRKQTWEGKS